MRARRGSGELAHGSRRDVRAAVRAVRHLLDARLGEQLADAAQLRLERDPRVVRGVEDPEPVAERGRLVGRVALDPRGTAGQADLAGAVLEAALDAVAHHVLAELRVHALD